MQRVKEIMDHYATNPLSLSDCLSVCLSVCLSLSLSLVLKLSKQLRGHSNDTL